MSNERNTLVGLYFHEEPLNWQGKILGQVEGDLLLVRLFSWLGDPIHLACLPMDRAAKLVLFDDADEWRDYGERKYRESHAKARNPAIRLLTLDELTGNGDGAA